MKLYTDNGELTLPDDFSFEIIQNSAFFSQDGTTSIPATIPATPADHAKLGWPVRLGRKDRYMNAYPVRLENGIFQKRGTLVVDSATSRGITGSIALENSDLYSKFKDKQIKDLMADEIDSAYSTVSGWVNVFNYVYVHPNGFNYRIFPVAVEKDDELGYQINNEPRMESGHPVFTLRSEAREIREGDEYVAVPEGYGIAPFLLLSAAVNMIINKCGFTVTYNCFSSDNRLNNLVLVHNCSDAICSGILHIADLLPSCKVGEFLQWLQKKFNVAVDVNSSTLTAQIVLMESILSGTPDIDLTGKCLDEMTYNYSPSSRVILKSDTSLDGAKPAAETLEELVKKYGSCADVTEAQFNTYGQMPDGLVRRTSTGDYYIIKRDVAHGNFDPVYVKERIGSSYFTYDRHNSDQSENQDAADLMPPMVFQNTMLMPYIGNRVNCRTGINGKEEEIDQDIIIVDYAGVSPSASYMYGTTQGTDAAGNARTGKYEIFGQQLYQQYWQRFNRMLLNNRVSVSTNLILTIKDILQYDLYRLKQLDGQRMIPTSLQYEVGSKIRCMNASFYLVKDFEDGVQDSETVMPPTLYAWTVNLSELGAWYNEMWQAYPGFDIRYDYSANDRYHGDLPPVFLPSPTALGQIAYRIQREIDYSVVNPITGSTEVSGTFSYWQWFDSVEI
ncbi:MAG: hypothetical protein K6E94_07260 [Elusimicrobiaceae bacterium]|nr:hypothetical protein [Elusimicrobiaceae bacterium]